MGKGLVYPEAMQEWLKAPSLGPTIEIKWARCHSGAACVTKPFKRQELLANLKQQLQGIKEDSQR